MQKKVAVDEDGNEANYADGNLTVSVVIVCIIAASAGMMFGYDVGVSGGVTTMEAFLKKFFPSVVKKMADAKQDQYCIFDSQIVSAFTSSLHFAGLFGSLIAAFVAVTAGRKATLLISGLFFLLGSALDAFALNIPMLLLGRIFLGFGIGFGNQAAPVYVSEMAPPKWRGSLNTAFQFFLSFGVVVAGLVNFGTARLGSLGWRLALGFAAVPAVLMTLGVLYIPDTPTSLIERGRVSEARQALIRVRGADFDTEAELTNLIVSSQQNPASGCGSYTKILQRRYRPHLVLTVSIPVFQQLTGINLVAFYGPVFFRSIGAGSDSALIGAIILGAVNLLSTLVSTCLVDRLGRRFLFLEGGVQICLAQVAIACVLGLHIGSSGSSEGLSNKSGIAVLVLLGTVSAAFAWSWGPLTWLVPGEILPTEIRAAGQGICIAFNLAMSFVLAQISLPMLCHLKYGLFILYAGLVAIITVFAALFVPETKGIPLQSMDTLWQRHWYWHRFLQQPSTSK